MLSTEPGWTRIETYAVDSYVDIRTIYDQNFEVAGWYTRLNLCIELWTWTYSEAWEPEDHM